jgi:putative molybdopterin biosynthesis protein
MNNIEKIKSFEQIKLLADPRRMQILQLLMDTPATLSQIATQMAKSPAWVRHHMLALEAAELIELSETRRTGKVTEKFYRVRAGAFLLQELILPQGEKPVIVFSGSHDIALEEAVEYLSPHVTILNLPVGSLDGLVNLRQKLCQVSGSHLVDEEGNYNTAFIRRIFPDRDMEIVTLAHRTQGLLCASGNPKGFRSLTSLTQHDIKFINRNPGSGTRMWLDTELKRMDIPISLINGYQHTVSTHSETARLIANHQVDVGIGLQAAAQQYELDFIPLFSERYDLVFPQELSAQLDILLNYIQSARFRKDLVDLHGYETSNTGKQVEIL